MNIKKERENALLDLSSWWGLHNPGYMGIAVKQDGTLFKYKSKLLSDDEMTVIKTLSLNEIDRIKKVLIDEEKVFETTYNGPMVFDAGNTVRININENKKEIENESKSYSSDKEEKIYDRLLNLLNELSQN